MNKIKRAKIEMIEEVLSSVKGMVDKLAKEEGKSQAKSNYAQGVTDSDMLYASSHLHKSIQYLIAARTDNRPSADGDTRFFGRKEIEGELVDLTDPKAIYSILMSDNDTGA